MIAGLPGKDFDLCFWSVDRATDLGDPITASRANYRSTLALLRLLLLLLLRYRRYPDAGYPIGSVLRFDTDRGHATSQISAKSVE